MAFPIIVPKNRTTSFQWNFQDSTGANVAIQSTDVPRFKLFRGDAATPDLEVDKTATTAGSVITIDDASTGQCTVQIAQADVASLDLGPYDCEIALVDDSATSPADAIISAAVGVAVITPTGGGDIALA